MIQPLLTNQIAQGRSYGQGSRGNVVQFKARPKLNNTLSPDIWENWGLKQEVVKKLIVLADTFQKTLAVDFKRKDLNIVGSMANFNYSKTSDIDLHLVTDFNEYPADKKLLKDYFHSKSDMFNYTNSFRFYGHPVEVSVEDMAQPTRTGGRYSVITGEWLKKPVFDDSIELPEVENSKVYQALKAKLDECIEKKRVDKISSAFQELYALRESGLGRGGKDVEFSLGNMVFKKLRREGYIKKMIDLSYAALNNLISLK